MTRTETAARLKMALEPSFMYRQRGIRAIINSEDFSLELLGFDRLDPVILTCEAAQASASISSSSTSRPFSLLSMSRL